MISLSASRCGSVRCDAENESLFGPVERKLRQVAQSLRSQAGRLTTFQDACGDVGREPGQRKDPAHSPRAQLFALGDPGNRHCPALKKFVHPPPRIGDESNQVRIAA